MDSQSCITNGAGLERVRYFSRQLITADDMLAEQQYLRQKLRRHNRFLHGWGVVCGLQVITAASDTYPWQVIVGPGYAVDPCGDEIYVAEPRCFNIADCIASVLNPCDPTAKSTPVLPDKVYLSICYRECETRPMRVHPLGCACDETLCEYSRVRDEFELICQTDSPPPPSKANCEICDGTLLVATCPPCPDNPCLVLAEITLPKATATKTDVMKIWLADTDINMLVRRQLLSTTMLQEQLRACCCPQPPSVLAADLEVTKEGNADPNDSTIFTYTITVTNHGLDHAEKVVVTDTLDSKLKYLKSKSDNWNVSGGNSLSIDIGTLQVGDSKKFTITARIQSPIPTVETKYINTVEVTSQTFDPGPFPNKASKMLTFTPPPPPPIA